MYISICKYHVEPIIIMGLDMWSLITIGLFLIYGIITMFIFWKSHEKGYRVGYYKGFTECMKSKDTKAEDAKSEDAKSEDAKSEPVEVKKEIDVNTVDIKKKVTRKVLKKKSTESTAVPVKSKNKISSTKVNGTSKSIKTRVPRKLG